MSGSELETTTLCTAKAGRRKARARHIRERESGMVKDRCKRRADESRRCYARIYTKHTSSP